VSRAKRVESEAKCSFVGNGSIEATGWEAGIRMVFVVFEICEKEGAQARKIDFIENITFNCPFRAGRENGESILLSRSGDAISGRGIEKDEAGKVAKVTRQIHRLRETRYWFRCV